MAYAVGIDVGTTYTAAALWRDQRVEVAALESHNVTVPSIIFAEGDDLLFGAAAAARGVTRPAGLARSFKRRLGDSVPIMLSGSPYSADRLVALFARWVVDSISEQIGEQPDNVVVTHPANWTEFQLHLLLNALDQVGLGDAGLLTEPQAAAHDFGTAAHLERGDLVLVYDLGGGTFDVALLRRDDVGFSHVGEPAGVERLGGIDFDEAVFQHVLGHVPDEVISQTREDTSGRMALAQLQRACVEAKESLSSEVAVEVPVVLPGHSSTVRLTRSEFEEMIRPMLRQTIDLSRQVLASAVLTPEALSAILLVGGSSRIPLVSEMVRQETGATVRVDAHPKLVVARGAGRWAGEHPGAAPRQNVRAATGVRLRYRAFAVGAGVLVAGSVLAFALTRGGDDEPRAESNDTTATVPATGPDTGVSSGTTAATSDVTSASTAPTEPAGRITWSTWGGGESLALGRDDGSIRVVDVATGDTLGTFTGHTGPVTFIAWSGPSRFATSSDDGTAAVWDLETSDPVVELEGHTGPLNYVKWGGDGTLLATSSADGTARVWDAGTGDELARFPHENAVAQLAWSPDSTRLATAEGGDTVKIWDIGSGEDELTLTGHTGAIEAISWPRGGGVLTTASADGTLRVWDETTGETTSELTGHADAVVHLNWAPGREQLASASDDGTVRIWDMVNREHIITLGEVGAPAIVSLDWSADASGMVTGSADGAVRQWDVSTGENVATLPGHTSEIIWAVWSRQNRILANDDDGSATIWDAETGDEIYHLTD